MSAPLARFLRVAVYTLAAFVGGSLVTGGLEGTDFRTNFDYGLKTGIPAAVILGAVFAVVEARKHRRSFTPAAVDRSPAAAAGRTEGGEEVSKATFAAGCFWGVEAVFRQLDGVIDTTVGYTGGTAENPSYRQVCSHTTGHAEAVEVEYDPDVISYDRLLEVFWAVHDPTSLNRQGLDVGDQYRSAIFHHDEDQRAAAVAAKDALEQSGRYRRPIVTQIVPAARFWPAEDYHQRYLEKNGHRLPKVPV